jgi:hypothetical protein
LDGRSGLALSEGELGQGLELVDPQGSSSACNSQFMDALLEPGFTARSRKVDGD